MDYAHEWTDKRLRAFEKEIAAHYKQPIEETQKRLEKYLEQFAEEDTQKRGSLTEKEYKQWRASLLTVAMLAILQALALLFYKSSKSVAVSVCRFAKDIYAENYNYGVFEIEKGLSADTSYTLMDSEDVEIQGAEIDQTKDMIWNIRQMNSVMLQLLHTDKPVSKIPKQFAQIIGQRNISVAVRAADRIITGVENEGRFASYVRTKKLGFIGLRQEWVATLDGRTRHTHRELDGQRVAIGEPFEVDGYTIRFPGDPHAAPEMICNCRCTLVCFTGEATFIPNDEIKKNIEIGDLTYSEWKHVHAR